MDHSLAIQSTATIDQPSADQPDDSADLTRAELEAIVDDCHGTDTPARKLWAYLHGPEAGRTSAYALAQRSGYNNNDPTSQWYVTSATVSQICRDIIGKVEGRGIARARAYQVMTDWTPARVARVLSGLLDSGDAKVAQRAADTSARCLGMMQSVAPQVNVNVGIVLSGRVSKLLSEALSEDADE
jgi:hypothetical protein